ncbi:hypothetical protein U9M48_022526 [Paspalum notatum var. saurae]|uniref:Aquaporin TIP5-1 n=1 Tax=Paspalum notatum var. saurae TaxID=547442 RepID=A0AAQ3TJU9_PASNO
MASGMMVMEFLPQWFSPPALRAYLAEFISTFLFMFATAGSGVSARMVTPDATSDAASLVTVAVAQAFALFVAVFIAADASGGHANPAVTFAFAIGGHIAVPTAVLYWVAQLLGATLACLVVHTLSAGQAVPTTRIAADMTGFGASVLEAVTTFMVVYTVHAACDPRVHRAAGRRGASATETATGSLAVGLVTGACALATASLTGASMNPARSFGPAVVGDDFTNQAVYWAGPMVGAALAALVHRHVVYPASSLPVPDPDPEARRGSVEAVVV